MKFIELKSSLKESLGAIYHLDGNDRYVLLNALELIEKRIGLNYPEMNKTSFNNESKYSLDDVIQSASSMPFGDEKRLVVVWDTSIKASEYAKFEKFVQGGGAEYCVFVFISSSPNEFCKKVKNLAVVVDCNKLDEITLKKWIVAKVGRSGLQIEEGAVALLIDYSNSSLARINSELDKLLSVGEPIITSSLIESFVVPDREYQIYELTDAISKGESERVFNIVETIMAHEKYPIGIIQYLYQSFRKLLFIVLSKKSDEDLAVMLKVKPYAVKMSRIQASKFTPKELKKINEQLSNLEFDIKAGRANVQNSVIYAICKILMIRQVK
ncbi:MAG: DNA polymerase III subunit delta [Clostridia bacterium]|nr:DNA polymerase III subunit delta [Clostridia bacterium]